jgi:hypothetical protein
MKIACFTAVRGRELFSTPQPVFGYLRHLDNTCAIKAAKKDPKQRTDLESEEG